MTAVLTLQESEFFLVFTPSLSSDHKGEGSGIKTVVFCMGPFLFLVSVNQFNIFPTFCELTAGFSGDIYNCSRQPLPSGSF